MTAVNKTNKDFFSHGANILMTKSKVRSITCEVVKKAKKGEQELHLGNGGKGRSYSF